jgi:predicted homoserine dehydrogenase-like protein
MIIVDRELERREAEGDPVRVGLVGAGFMGSGIALQILSSVPGMELSVISNRHPQRAEDAYGQAGLDDTEAVGTVAELEDAVRRGRPAVTDDPTVVCRAESLDAVLEVTGAVEFGARVVLDAIRHGKHVVTMSAELDGTVGPILRAYADREGVVYTVSDGDQPGVTMNLVRFVEGIGVKPVMCGNIKGFHDPYRNPTTQEGFAEKWGQDVKMVTSFADGTKISFEQAIVANATGMRVARRGMHGPTVEEGTPVEEAADWYPEEDLRGERGIVDYVVGASPAPGVFVLGTHDHPVQQHYLELYKLGEGPFYVFYRPYHLCHFEAHNSVARAVCFGDATLAPDGGPEVDVVATAKVDLSEGDELDGVGGYRAYGLAENVDVMRREDLLPMGLSEGCRVVRDVPRDGVLTYGDVEVPEGRLCDRLRAEQEERFGARTTTEAAP